jgi:hypothetical protein
VSAQWLPVDWRNKCTSCGRFLPAKSFRGTAYTPTGPNLEFDNYTDFFNCRYCDMDVAADLVVTRVQLVDLDEEVAW